MVSLAWGLGLTTSGIGARRSLSRVQAPRTTSQTSFKFSYTYSSPMRAMAMHAKGNNCVGPGPETQYHGPAVHGVRTGFLAPDSGLQGQDHGAKGQRPYLVVVQMPLTFR